MLTCKLIYHISYISSSCVQRSSYHTYIYLQLVDSRSNMSHSLSHLSCSKVTNNVIKDILYDACLQREVCWIIANVDQEGTHVSKRKMFRKVTHPSRTQTPQPIFRASKSIHLITIFTRFHSQKSTQTYHKRQLRGCSAQAHLMNSRIQNSFLSFSEITSGRLPNVPI